MAEWLRRQIRIVLTICFPLGAQVQILLVSFSFPLKGGSPRLCPFVRRVREASAVD